MLALLNLFPLAAALPEGKASKYVAAAYIVFVVLLVIYLAIMAAKLGRIERELRDLAGFAESRKATEPDGQGEDREEVSA